MWILLSIVLYNEDNMQVRLQPRETPFDMKVMGEVSEGDESV